MVDSDGQVASIIVPSKLRSRHLSLLESAGDGHRFLELRLFFNGAGGLASDALISTMLGERSGKREFVYRLMRGLLDLLLREVLLGEISKGTVGVLGSKAVLPWSIGLVALLAEHALELVLA